MKTVKENITNEIIINKSKFITIITKINSLNDINQILKNTKKTYKNATHYCFAYIINGKEKCKDDGEPSGTAGIPILNVLKQNNLTNILCIVIRYFGGIKLGAGGLIRAYSNSVKKALNKTKIVNIQKGYNIIIEVPYEHQKQIDYLLKEENIKKDYQTNIIYTFEIEKNKYEQIENKIKTLSKIKTKRQINIAS